MNVGCLNPIRKIRKIAKEHGIIFLVDSAQTVGVFPINVEEMNIDLLAFPGHKSLFGCQGVGRLYINRRLVLKTLREGGTGGKSESLEQPLRLKKTFKHVCRQLLLLLMKYVRWGNLDFQGVFTMLPSNSRPQQNTVVDIDKYYNINTIVR
ncbi:MAG: cysteine desulfurase family protein [Firmicutes bacterium]|nr:cysteine desulfurase family protein [Bacillota bacterium]